MSNGKIPRKTRISRQARRAQADVLERLRRSRLAETKYQGLRKCTAGRCGMQRCRDVCRYGNLRRRGEQVKAVLRLFQKCDAPYFEVRIGHGAWSRPFGQLARVNLAAAKQLNRRGFDALHVPSMVAVGMLKVSLSSEEEGGQWKPVIHSIVCGVEREDIEKAFMAKPHPRHRHYVLITPITNLKTAIARVLSVESADRLQDNDGFELVRPKASVRGEYYRWALRFDAGARLIRYGCDRHFNKLKKNGRTIRPKVRKPRPNPTWLARWQFGTYEREQWDRYRDPEPKPKRKPTVHTAQQRRAFYDNI
jgi:hypothetical protein